MIINILGQRHYTRLDPHYYTVHPLGGASQNPSTTQSLHFPWRVWRTLHLNLNQNSIGTSPELSTGKPLQKFRVDQKPNGFCGAKTASAAFLPAHGYHFER